MNSNSSLPNKSIYMFSMIVLITLILQNIPTSFGEEVGNIRLDLAYENGDRVDTWQTTLKIFQDNSEEPFAVVDFPNSNPYEIKALPLDHKYDVEVFVNDMFAEERYVFLDEPEEELKILLPLSAGSQIVVYHNDGQTPIEGATVSIKSHEGKEWAKGNTDSDGKTIRFWLQPNNLVQDNYYIAEISLAEGIVFSEFPIKLFPQVIGDVKIITPWTVNIENLITINVYKENLQKVQKTDGIFIVELYDSENNKVSQSNVNHRGEAYFSNIDVDRYSIVVIKIGDEEDEIWATKVTPITGDEGFFSVYKEGVKAESSITTCNCVAFRLDDVQDYYLRGPQLDIMELFQQKNADLTIGIIGSVFGTDPLLVNYIERGLVNEFSTLEIASHSYSNAKLTALSKSEQKILLEKTNEVLQDTLGVTPKTLIPPLNLFDENTLEISVELGFTHITGHIDENHSPPYLGVDSEILYFPANTETAMLNQDGVTWTKQERSVILEEIKGSIDENGFAVVMMHPYEFTIEELGAYTTETDQYMINEVGKLIDEVKASGIEIVTISEINEKIIQPGQESIEKEESDDEKTFKAHCAQQFEPFVNLNNCDLTKQDLFQLNLTAANLSGADLSDSKFMRIDFTNADLSESILSSVDYFQGILSGADLSGADLTNSKIEEVAVLDTNFSNAILKNIQITNLNARGSNFSGADFTGADVKGAGISNADFTGAILSDSNFSTINLANSKFNDAKLDRINLTEATLSGSDLSGADLTEADLTKTILRDANLSNTVLLQIILDGADISNSILYGANLSGMDLTAAGLKGVDLTNADLSETNLAGVDLSGSSLQGTNLSGSDLSNVILRGVDLSGTVLKGINLTGVDLSDSNLDGVDLSNTLLKGTNLSRVLLNGASLFGSDLSESILIGIDFTVAEFNDVNFSNSDLSNANLSGIDLTGVKLTGTNLSNADLSDANLSGVVLTNTNLSNADLSDANLSGVDLAGAIFENVNFSNTDMRRISIVETNLSGINFSGSNLKGADFSYSNLSGADFTSSILESADLSYTNLSGADLSNSVLESADMFKTTITNADFSGADMTNVDIDFQDLEKAITDDETELPEKGFFFFRELYSLIRALFGF
ncbi:MAG: pentapeptide repeat-containing protein [Nitrosopumilus sp.]